MKKVIAIFVMTLAWASLAAPPPASASSPYGTLYSGGVVTGNWDGIGGDTVGRYDFVTGNWILDDWNAADPRHVFQYSGWEPAGTEANWLQRPIVGDWNGDGIDTPGFYDREAGWWDLRNSNSTGGIEVSFAFGPAGSNDVDPIVGDWNGDGVDTVGLFDKRTEVWTLRNSNTSGPADVTFRQYFQDSRGTSSLPLAGDWNGDGVDTIGLTSYTGTEWWLTNSNGVDTNEHYLSYGYDRDPASHQPRFTGDWDGNGTDTPAVIKGGDPNGFRLRNSNTSGQPDWMYDMTYLVRYDCNRFPQLCA